MIIEIIYTMYYDDSMKELLKKIALKSIINFLETIGLLLKI